MRDRRSTRLGMLGVLLLVGGVIPAVAGTIDVGEYFPLGPRNSWRYPVQGTIKVEVGVGPINKSATLRLTGTASTTWSAGEPVDTPAGGFTDVLGLALVLDLRIAGSVVGVHVDETVTEQLTGTVARGTGLVVVRQQGETFVLTQALVGRGPLGGLCPPGRFLLPEGVQLVPGGAVTEDVIVVEPGQVAIGSGCERTAPRAAGKGTLVKLRAKWPRCGQLKRVKLKATLDGTSCDRLVGTLTDRRSRTPFTALRSSCGDGVFDLEGEQCDAGRGCDAAETCARDCTCEAARGGSAGGAILRPAGAQP